MKNNKNSAQGPWDYFHDCHICQGMNQGRGQTMEDLKKLFDETEEVQNARKEA